MKVTKRTPSLIFSLSVAIMPLVSAVIVSASAYGDEAAESAQPRYQRPTTRQYNDRLPPVMPGEEIVTETGQKMKTWSSAGPVPVNRRPPPQALGDGSTTSGVGVIIDGRDRYGYEPGGNGGGGVQPLAPRRR